jgi:hypothetical protein
MFIGIVEGIHHTPLRKVYFSGTKMLPTVELALNQIKISCGL